MSSKQYSGRRPRPVSKKISSSSTKDTESTWKEDDQRSRTNCCRCCCCLFCCLVLLIIAGGITLWQLLPEKEKEDLTAFINNGAVPTLPKDDELPPKKAYAFNQCGLDNDNTDLCCNGVDTICDIPANKVMFASVHNAMASSQDGFRLARNHNYRLEYALEYGYRGISLDLAMCAGKLAFIHAKCLFGQRDPLQVFTHINNFLDKNPNEVLLITLEINNNADGIVNLDDFYNILLQIDGLTERLVKHNNDTQPWPTLRTMIENDERIMLFHYNGPTCQDTMFGCPQGFHDYFHYVAETTFEYDTPQEMLNASRACLAPRGAKGLVDFFGLNVFMRIPLEETAATINTKQFVENQIQLCSNFYNNAIDINMVFVDFWEKGNVVEVVQEHNKQLGVAYQESIGNTRNRLRRRQLFNFDKWW